MRIRVLTVRDGQLPLRLRIFWTLRARPKIAAVAALACVAGLAWIGSVCWYGPADRSVAVDRAAPVDDRMAAVDLVQRDILDGTRLLQELRSEGGPISNHAVAALAPISEALR